MIQLSSTVLFESFQGCDVVNTCHLIAWWLLFKLKNSIQCDQLKLNSIKYHSPDLHKTADPGIINLISWLYRKKRIARWTNFYFSGDRCLRSLVERLVLQPSLLTWLQACYVHVTCGTSRYLTFTFSRISAAEEMKCSLFKVLLIAGPALVLYFTWNLRGQLWNSHVTIPTLANERNCSGLALVNDMGRMGNKFFEFLAARVVAERWNLQLCVSQTFAQAFVSYFVGLSKRVSAQRCRQSELRSVEFTEIYLKNYRQDMQVDCDENVAISGKRGGSNTGWCFSSANSVMKSWYSKSAHLTLLWK